MNAQTETEDAGRWECVDNRPFECPNGHGIMETESSLSVYCPRCDYSRVVFEYVENPDE